MSNFSNSGFQAQQQSVQVEGVVPAALLVELAGKFYQDREADRVLARELCQQLIGLGLAALEQMRLETQERAEERMERQRAERAERRANRS
jgi:hypothetical protein